MRVSPADKREHDDVVALHPMPCADEVKAPSYLSSLSIYLIWL